MKRISLLITLSICFATSQAQDISDGLRYSSNQNLGTARYTALSGSMGALGGDFSAISSNPASGGVFLTSTLSLSSAFNNLNNNSIYFNTEEEASKTDFSLNQLGAIFVINNANKESSFKKFTIGLNYNQSNNFENKLLIAGTGNNTIGNFFLEQAQGLPLNLLDLRSGETITDLYQYLGETEGSAAQNAFLGYQGFLFDPVDPSNPLNSEYISNIAEGVFNQEYAYLSQGYNSKFTINFATQVTNNLYFGANINTHTIEYDQSTFLLEKNNNPGSIVKSVGFENNLSVTGSGISAQIGGIAKVANNFRLGLSFDTPTWYQIAEETTQSLKSSRVFEGKTINEFIDPRVINVYEDYNLKTPAKVTASAAYIFGQSGLISFDYSYKDYSSIKFSRLNNYYDPYFDRMNNSIKNTLKAASKFSAGAEYRFNRLSLRGGFHYEETPYKDNEVMGDLTGFSLGAGYNFGRFYADIAYSRSEQERNQQLYSVGLTDTALINSVYNNFILSLGFNL
ncbi:OmpP1/FadL family transporter [Aequorivita xiaoshiensis]|uniref:Outer membrane protein transport protein n=1 Tax=Aequorivita xiaoshiensis TaxID=2874476 RepID=A0A9X1R3B7_9FLAO|nr:outer membrane protein transport protein [Aequorivita xiaoshiensis]MCG2431162.1 outer membrane protein transport protein [Aequorivita xiaoshiensis]